jgi:NAD(P)-dependent dehydrogenase (short-subunit alcohol dehydrogenase family)
MSRTGAFVISGSGSGIGLALAHRLIADGHFVFGLGRDRAKLKAASKSLPGGHFVFCAADLAAAAGTHAAVLEIRDWLEEKRLPLLGLVNNAGVVDRIAFHLTSDAIWERQFHNNLMSAVRLTRELYPSLQKGKPSSVLNISSNLGLHPISHISAYSAIKAAMINWTQALALEWAADGIRVNCICPGIVDTPIHSFHGHADSDHARAQAHQVQPLGRMGQPEEIAEAAEFLLGPKSAWTTGSVLVVDGGASL